MMVLLLGLEQQLKTIQQQSEGPPGVGVGALTTGERDSWVGRWYLLMLIYDIFFGDENSKIDPPS